MSIQSKTGRILTLVTVLMLLMLSLSGCGGSSGEETSDPDETSKVSRIYLASPFFSDTEEEAVSRADTIAVIITKMLQNQFLVILFFFQLVCSNRHSS